jgi:hypothetical protein
MRMILHFITTYHSSANDQFERTHQTVEIVIRFSLMKDEITNFIKIISSIQSTMNNFSNTFTELSSNEVLYDFKITKSLDLLNDPNSSTELKKERKILRAEIDQVIVFVNVVMKIRYDSTRKFLNWTSTISCTWSCTKITFNQNYSIKSSSNSDSNQLKSWKR